MVSPLVADLIGMKTMVPLQLTWLSRHESQGVRAIDGFACAARELFLP